MAHQATDTIMQAASEGATTISRQMSGLLDRQVGSGADMIHQVASSTRLAADDLDANLMPQVAGMVRTVADRIDTYADDIRDKSVEQILGTASELTRRQPAVVFGFAALAGFLAFRALGSIPSRDIGKEAERYGA
ncbi:hypothetical protein [Arvimicrobium flavum]|uniref:hypothetical protein n=1 Tax=Arvimicrobium flavum TaxID=3393320 RepID=UPI00237BD665|nr:hypothetical protein [Mesorhizobium shangrilense]